MPMILPRYFSLLAACLIGLTLCACSPDYNWREASVADGAAQIAFPSRVMVQERVLNVDGAKIAFTLTSASVGEAVFAVGYAKPDGDPGEEFLNSLARRTVNSLAAHGGEPAPGAFEGEVFELDTVVAGQPSRLVARVLVHRGMLLEVVASGPKSALHREQALDFMRSLVLR